MFDRLKQFSNAFFTAAMAIPTDYMSDIHEQELRKHFPKGREVIVYHGTSSKHLAKILQHGSLDPTESVKHKAWENTTPGIYVTRNSGLFSGAEMYAGKAAQEIGGDPVVIDLVIPLDWIDQDPDDTRVTETGTTNDLGRFQGIVHRPISIKRIKGIKIYFNQELAKYVGAGQSMITETGYIHIGKMLDGIKKAIKAGANLGPEYHEMVGERPRGMARDFASEDIEHIAATLFDGLHDNYFSPQADYNGKSAYEKALVLFFKNRTLIYSNALNGLRILFDDLQPGMFQRFEDEVNEPPKPNEALINYLRRA